MTSEPLLSPVVDAAIRMAATAHRTQRRKGSDLPYIVHPAAIVSILQRAGFRDECVLAAAWLHDVVEDTGVTLEEIQAAFPAKVAEIVDAMSEDKVDESGVKLKWAQRKAHHLKSMTGASLDAKAVMLADKLHNLTSIKIDSEGNPRVWDRFNASKEELLGYYRKMIATSEGLHELDALRTECERVLAQLAGG